MKKSGVHFFGRFVKKNQDEQYLFMKGINIMNLKKIDKKRKIGVAALEHELEIFTAYMTNIMGYKTANVNCTKPIGKMHPYYEIVRDRSITWVSLVEYKPRYPTTRDDLSAQIEDKLLHLAVWSDRSLERRLTYVIKFDRCEMKEDSNNTPELYDRAYLLLGDKELSRGSRNDLSPEDITDYLQIHFDFGTAEGKVIQPESEDPLREFLQIGSKQRVNDFYFSRWLMTELKVWKILRSEFPDDDDQTNDMRLVIRYEKNVARLGREATAALMKHRAKALQKLPLIRRSSINGDSTNRVRNAKSFPLKRPLNIKSGSRPPRNLKKKR
jgi:hypothetical protein